MIAQVAAVLIAEFAREIGQVQEILDFPPPSEDFIYRFAVGYDCSGELAQALFVETKKFLVMCAADNEGRGFAPSVGIALMLKHFTRWPEGFRTFCSLLGLPDFFIGTTPNNVIPRLDYAATRQSFEELFGQRDQQCWTSPVSSDVCVAKSPLEEQTD